jgi:phenylalanyl-tRNA synthetase beta chain
MKISLNWLGEYVGISSDPTELAEKLTMAGIEVEAIEKHSVHDNIVCAEILERKPHPNADKLSICSVFDGLQKYQVVCGALNCDPGVKVPLAKLGTVLTDKETGKQFKIEKRELRKIPSEGMLCSAKELGIEEKSDGIMLLDNSIPAGARMRDIFPDDVVFDLEITPNRPDLMSHFGIARELAALYKTDFKIPSIANFADPGIADFKEDIVSVLDQNLCSRYTGIIIKNVRVKESPLWLKNRIRQIGLRPINNVVDITNFVLFETGQPLHSFDLAKLKGGKIRVRRAQKGEKITTLDNAIHELNENILLICDENNPVALAGIMGGQNSGIDNDTKDIFIESAYFLPSNIRASSKFLQISSDSSRRFERGVDFEMVTYASGRAVSLILELAGGKTASPFIDINSGRQKPVPVTCRSDKIRSLLGMDIDDSVIIEIFQRLGCGAAAIPEKKEICVVQPPSYREDLRSEADLAEEILRVCGISNLPSMPPKSIIAGNSSEDVYRRLETVRNQLISLGLTECLNYSFFEKQSALLDARFSENTIVPIANPLSSDSEYMRPSLLAGLLATVNRNISRGLADLSLFEIGNVVSKNNGKITEKTDLCVVLTGRKHPERFSDEKSELYDFFDVKGIVESLFEMRYTQKELSFEKLTDVSEKSIFTERALSISNSGVKIGLLGEISPCLAADTRLNAPLYMILLDLTAILKINDVKSVFTPFSLFPSVARDIAMLVDESFEHDTFVKFVLKQNIPYLESFELFDVFSDEKIGKGKKSMAYSFCYRDMRKSLTDDEVNIIHEKLRAKATKELPITLR